MAFKTMFTAEAGTSATGSGAEVAVTAYVGDNGSQLFTAAATTTFDQLRQVVPRANIQRVGIKLEVDGVDITDSILGADFSVNRSLDAPIQSARFDLGIVDGVSVLGNALNLGAPASGLKPIDVSAIYRTDSMTEFSVPLISAGIADETSIRADRVVRESLTVADKGRLYRDKLGTLIQPAGSNLTRNRIATKLVQSVGITPLAIPRMAGTVAKPIELIESQPLPLAQQIVEIDGWHLLWDPEGTFTAVQHAQEKTPGRARWLYTEKELVRSINGQSVPFIIQPSPEAWTKVELRGTKQVLRDNCALKTTPLTSFGLVDEVSPAYPFEQSSITGAVSNTGIGPLSGSRVGSRTITSVTFRCRDLIIEDILTYALFNPTRARYRKDVDGSQLAAGSGGYNRVFLLADSADEIGHFYPLPRLLLVERKRKERVFIGGELKQVRERTWGWYNPRRHIKSRAATSDAWETATADTQWWDLGNGEAVINREDGFQVTEERTTEYVASSDGYVKNRRERVYAWSRKEGGGLYLYGDGTTSSDSQEVYRLVSEVLDDWTQVNEELVSHQVRRYGIDRKWLDSLSEVSFGTAPAVEVLADDEPDAADFDTTEEFEAAKSASKFEAQEIEASCDAPNLELVRPERRMKPTFIEWAENEAELLNLCNRLLLEGIASRVRFVVPFNARMREGDLVHVRCRQPGVNFDRLVVAKKLRHRGSVGGAKVTEVDAQVRMDPTVLN